MSNLMIKKIITNLHLKNRLSGPIELSLLSFDCALTHPRIISIISPIILILETEEFSPFKINGLSNLYQLGESLSNSRVVGGYIMIFNP